MRDIKEDLYDDTLKLWNMAATQSSPKYSPAGKLFTFESEAGKGEYWAYFHENLFAINAFDMSFIQEGIMRTTPQEHLSITYYDIVKGMTQNFGAPLQTGCASVYLADNNDEYISHYDAGSRVKAVSLTISPDCYRDYLQRKFGRIEDVRKAFLLMDGRLDLPELALLLKRARAYKGEGITANLYYEGVVSEAVALVLEKAQEITLGNQEALSTEDAQYITSVCEYISENLDQDLSVSILATKAYVGQTKLKQLFKTATGLTPSDYVTQERINKAMELLTETDMPISAICMSVGYANPATFSTAFKRYTDYTPSELRQ